MTDLTRPAQTSRLPADSESRADGCTFHATVTQHAQPSRDTEPDNTRRHGAQAEPRQAEARERQAEAPDSPACPAQAAPDPRAAMLRCAELEADLAAQRVYSGRALADALAVINRLRTERAEVERWQADRQRQLENWEAEKRGWEVEKRGWEADRQALLAACETDRQKLLQAWQIDRQSLEQRIAAFTASTSWRMMAPMRMAGRPIRTILAMLQRGQ
jgi:hypothetical protein